MARACTDWGWRVPSRRGGAVGSQYLIKRGEGREEGRREGRLG